jgi:hypothetical protein
MTVAPGALRFRCRRASRSASICGGTQISAQELSCDSGGRGWRHLRCGLGKGRRRGFRARSAARQEWAVERRGEFSEKKVETTRSVRVRIDFVERSHPELSMRRQCDILSVARPMLDYRAVPENSDDIRIKRHMEGLSGRFLPRKPRSVTLRHRVVECLRPNVRSVPFQ